MDHLSPDDIVGYRFKQSLRGYAIEEVDALLDRLADQVERHQAELEQLRERLRAAEAEAARTRETEATLQRTLVVAQQAAERNSADASAQAEATLASAAADAERLRREAEEAAAQVRAEASGTAARTLEDAQQLARREVEAARARVEDAAERHAEVLASVAAHRDALRGHLSSLEELTLQAPPAPRVELVAGELPHDGSRAADGAEPADGAPLDGHDGPAESPATRSPEATGPLTVRVHEGSGDPSSDAPPLGSGARDGDH